MFRKALALHQKGEFAAAAAAYRKVLQRDPDNAEALHNLGAIELQKQNPSAALPLFDRATGINPKNAAFWCNRGSALRDLERFDEALASFDRSLAIKPDFVEALSNRGHTLLDLKRYEDAFSSYDLALAIKPDYARAWTGRGTALQSLKRFDDALPCYDRALSINPNDAVALYNRGNSLRGLNRLDEALLSYDRAISIVPNYAIAQSDRGFLLKRLGRFNDAIASFDRLLAIEPDNASVFGERLLSRMSICDWTGLHSEFQRFAEIAVSGRHAAEPFSVLASPLSAEQQRTCAELYIKRNYPSPSPNPKLQAFKHSRIRLGYFSADFRDHPVGRAISGLIEHHDRNRFEVIGFALVKSKRDPVRIRLEKAFDRLFDVSTVPDSDVAAQARNVEVDIAVDLTGFTEGSRTGVFAFRPAPIQVNYLGYPGTIGADYIDYLIADRIIIPGGHQQHYAEKIAYLPHTYMPGSADISGNERNVSRKQFGLPEGAFVFCCFNGAYKITPGMFDIWMRVLERIENSVLWLGYSNNSVLQNLRSEAGARGIGQERLVFTRSVPDREGYLARLTLADLFLDTLPYNAHATACDALCAGLPVLTCSGATFPGRVAASLLNAAGIPELIASDPGEYEALATRLALNPQQLLSLRQQLAKNHASYPLFNPVLFARNIESVYVAMMNRQQSGLGPDHIQPSA